MIINPAKKFIDKVSTWSSYFTIAYWVIALMPVAAMAFVLAMGGGPRRGDEGLFLILVIIFYLAVTYFFHRLTLLVVEFMKAMVTTSLESTMELKALRTELKQRSDEASLEQNAGPQPFKY